MSCCLRKIIPQLLKSISVLLSYEYLNTMYLLYLHNVHLHHTLWFLSHFIKSNEIYMEGFPCCLIVSIELEKEDFRIARNLHIYIQSKEA